MDYHPSIQFCQLMLHLVQTIKFLLPSSKPLTDSFQFAKYMSKNTVFCIWLVWKLILYLLIVHLLKRLISVLRVCITIMKYTQETCGCFSKFKKIVFLVVINKRTFMFLCFNYLFCFLRFGRLVAIVSQTLPFFSTL